MGNRNNSASRKMQATFASRLEAKFRMTPEQLSSSFRGVDPRHFEQGSQQDVWQPTNQRGFCKSFGNAWALLVASSRAHVAFLRRVHAAGVSLQRPSAESVRRYRELWLPLLASRGLLLAVDFPQKLLARLRSEREEAPAQPTAAEEAPAQQTAGEEAPAQQTAGETVADAEASTTTEACSPSRAAAREPIGRRLRRAAPEPQPVPVM